MDVCSEGSGLLMTPSGTCDHRRLEITIFGQKFSFITPRARTEFQSHSQDNDKISFFSKKLLHFLILHVSMQNF